MKTHFENGCKRFKKNTFNFASNLKTKKKMESQPKVRVVDLQ